MNTRLVLQVTALLAAGWGLSAPAQAQVAPEEIARRLVGEGIEAAKSRDWLKARESFERAYEIQPLPLTRYNLAAAQEKTGQYVEADRSYRIFLRETMEGEYPKFREAATKRRIKLRERIAYVVVRAPDIAPDDTLLVDEQELSHAVLGEAIPSNPGSVKVRVMRGGREVASASANLGPGDSRVFELTVPPAPLPGVVSAPPPPVTGGGVTAAPAPNITATAPPPADEEEDSGVLGSPWFWTIVGVVVAGGAGTAAYFVMRPESPFESSLGSVDIAGR